MSYPEGVRSAENANLLQLVESVLVALQRLRVTVIVLYNFPPCLPTVNIPSCHLVVSVLVVERT